MEYAYRGAEAGASPGQVERLCHVGGGVERRKPRAQETRVAIRHGRQVLPAKGGSTCRQVSRLGEADIDRPSLDGRRALVHVGLSQALSGAFPTFTGGLRSEQG